MDYITFHEVPYKEMDTVAKIIRSSASWYKDFVEPEDMFDHEVGKKWIDKNYNKRDFYLGRSSEENKPVGTVSLQFFDDVVYLGYVYLKTDYVGKRYGRQFLEFARKKALENSAKEMILIAHPEATWATKAYEKFGFKKYSSDKEKILSYKNGLLKPYYEEGFHLYIYKLSDK